MTETVTVFKNISNQTPSANNVGFDVPVLTTTATQRAVIKDVVTKGFTPAGVTLDLDGFPAVQGQNLSHDGNLIMGPSSTLKLKVAMPTPLIKGFEGMFFAEGSTGTQYFTSDGTSASVGASQTGVGANPAHDATAGKVGDEMFFYRLYSNIIYKHNSAGTLVNQMSYGSTGYGLCNDGNYLYRTLGSGGNSTVIYQWDMVTHNVAQLNTNSIYETKQSNQGSYFLHHDGKLYSKREGSSNEVYVIDLATMNVVTLTDSNFQVGSYSDGAAVTTTLAGITYIVEVGTSYWSYLNITTGHADYGVVVRTYEGTSGSTEYGQGGGEISPGIVLVFGEQSDSATVIDMNTIKRTHSTGDHGFTSNTDYGNTFAFAAKVDSILVDYTYDAYVSGILIEE
jgi:hypothetical protein